MKFPFFTAAAFAVPFTVFSTAPTVTSVSVVSAAGHADVVIGVESPVEVQDFTLDSPRRVVIDLKGVALTSAAPAYDHVLRGGISDVRVSQLKPNTVRIVIQLDSVHAYEIKQNAHEVRVAVSSGQATFAAWLPKLGGTGVEQGGAQQSEADSSGSNGASQVSPLVSPSAFHPALTPPTQLSQQPRITMTYEDADIHDVIAAFAAFSGRTIVVGRNVAGTVTAEIRNQPWDVALRAILQGQGLAAAEDPSSGIIMVDSYANIQAKQLLEPLVTQIIPINYAKADSLVPIIAKLLARDCTQNVGQSAQGQGGMSSAPCTTRGAVASNPSTNTIIVTETQAHFADIANYVRRLDIPTRQVAIKAKIIFVDRTDIENLGLSYDLGTAQQFFTQLVTRDSSNGTPFTANQILLGGNTLSAIANANNRVTSPALSLVYSAAVGKFSLTSFLDALREVQLADLQAEPSLMTVDNKEAKIQVGQDIPIRVVDLSTSSSGAAGNAVPVATVSFRSVGIILKVTPHVTSNGQILMDVYAENSNAQTAASDVGYIFNKQYVENRLLVGDGETAAMAGLTVTQITSDRTGIPFLMDLPMIGQLFGTTNRSEEKRDLLILITPHIIEANEQSGPGEK